MIPVYRCPPEARLVVQQLIMELEHMKPGECWCRVSVGRTAHLPHLGRCARIPLLLARANALVIGVVGEPPQDSICGASLAEVVSGSGGAP